MLALSNSFATISRDITTVKGAGHQRRKSVSLCFFLIYTTPEKKTRRLLAHLYVQLEAFAGEQLTKSKLFHSTD